MTFSSVANAHIVPLLVSGYLPRDVSSTYNGVFGEVSAGKRSHDEIVLAREALEGFTVGAAVMVHIETTAAGTGTGREARRVRERIAARKERFEHVVRLLVNDPAED